jgi:diguanylate cyclase (GGDEF)-like protein
MPNRGTLLIVDDDPVTVVLLVGLLDADFKIETATSGPEALELAEIVKPDLILLDVMMPRMDGFEVCTRLKSNARTADIPVIFISARSDAEAEACGLELGASDYVTKPISPPIMLARVRNHIAFKRARDALAAIALLDGLTGLANRRRFDETLAAECGRLSRHAGLLSLILFDLDRFKLVNDTWGHLVGDECLKKVGVVARAALHRTTDIAARYGGEEFACILPETNVQGALHVANAIREGIAALTMPDGGSNVTASFGVCTVVYHQGIAPIDLIAAADRCLYQAKSAGRNRVVHAEPDAPLGPALV